MNRRAIKTEILISEVAMAWMLMLYAARASTFWLQRLTVIAFRFPQPTICRHRNRRQGTGILCRRFLEVPLIWLQPVAIRPLDRKT